MTRHHQILYNPRWETVTSHGIARAATKCPPPGDPLQPPVGDDDVTRHHQTLYIPRLETVT